MPDREIQTAVALAEDLHARAPIGFVKFSWGLTALTIFDMLLVWLTWREYQAKRASQKRVVHAGPPLSWHWPRPSERLSYALHEETPQHLARLVAR